MFDVTSDDIASLNDEDLRELVGRLCEAELSLHGLSPAAATWGGNQTAADGGLDVRVAAATDTSATGFIPRRSTGFQVKTPDMPRAAILSEMRPSGELRPIIRDLAAEGGAYIIVSSHGSTTDSTLGRRRAAVREALRGTADTDRLFTDFYDRTRMASWVRRHPGLVLWVKERVGRAITGWRPYGAWSGSAEAADAEYLIDDKLSLHLDIRSDVPPPMIEAIDKLRDSLAVPRATVRLVGLSGVGKTRLVQALFDDRIGSHPLPQALAVYTNLSDNPTPQPNALASDLIANRTRAILIVDNCPSDLHRTLSDLCRAPGSTVGVITVEYDVRDDQPEGTQVVRLDTSSPELIEKLVKRRFPNLSAVDASTIADASGGNARIAVALADTVERTETIAGLSDDELFQRLFRQRHDDNDALLRAAQACSLVYSFQGEALSGGDAELPRLAVLADQSPQEIYRHVGELLRRNLAQKRSVWRAILPHAIANRLAARALEDTPYDLIQSHLITEGTDRLARSFSRRLSFLYAHPRAVEIVERWLAPGGMLGNVIALNDLGHAMFANIASVSPEATLAALERVTDEEPEAATSTWRRYRLLLRSLAYDPKLFERSVSLLVRAATEFADEREAKETTEVLTSLFPLYLSGTHATCEQRSRITEELLRSADKAHRALGLAAFHQTMNMWHLGSGYLFEFGARSRDYGYQPKSRKEEVDWYNSALALIKHFTLVEGRLKFELRELLAKNFRGLWSLGHLFDKLEELFRRFAAETFWREGWIACREAIRFDKDRLTPEALSRLTALEAELRPTNLTDEVRAIAVGSALDRGDLADLAPGDDFEAAWKRLAGKAHDLGAAVATDTTTLKELVPDLFRGGTRIFEFGRGLADGSNDRRETWAILLDGLRAIHYDQPNAQVLAGYIAELWMQDESLVQELLDGALKEPHLVTFIPALHSAVQIDTRGVDRLKKSLELGDVPTWAYQGLAYGRATDHLSGRDLKDLLSLILERSDGFPIALEILSMRLFSDRQDQRAHEPELVVAGRDLLRHLRFERGNARDDYNLSTVARACLVEPEGSSIAAEIAGRLKRAVTSYEAFAFENDDLLKALLNTQPSAVLDTLFDGDEAEQRAGVRLFDDLGTHHTNPADEVSSELLVEWCERDSASRYPLAAAVVTFASRAEENAPQIWSEQAKALLARCPDPTGVLAVFVDRFRPRSWSGSRATLMEANAGLLDQLDADAPDELRSFAARAKSRLEREIAREREWETEHDRKDNERFE